MDKDLRKYFFVSMMFCFLLLTMIMGFTIVEKNAEAIISGESPSLISYRIRGSSPKFFKIHFMGQDFTLNFE